jgi:hypothetical protein
MRSSHGGWKCDYCGNALDVPADATPQARLTAGAGKPTYRVFVLDGEEVHRCETSKTVRSPNSG